MIRLFSFQFKLKIENRYQFLIFFQPRQRFVAFPFV